EAAEAVLAYADKGVEFHEQVVSAVIFVRHSITGPAGGEAHVSVYGQSLPSFSLRAPAGQLDAKLVETMRASPVMRPQWCRRMQELAARTEDLREEARLYKNRDFETGNWARSVELARRRQAYLESLGHSGAANVLEAYRLLLFGDRGRGIDHRQHIDGDTHGAGDAVYDPVADRAAGTVGGKAPGD
ncbi:MAG: hypothetical protein ACK5HY_15030, partial [Parahaliea sp.]